jgi:hypothetical protein
MNPQGHQTGAGGHERKDADVFSLALVATMLLLSIGVCLLICWGVLHALNRNRVAHESKRARAVAQGQQVPEPRLLVHPGAEWNKVRTEEEAKLNSYDWVDRPAGTVRIPVTRAMQLLVERGLPEVGAGQTRLQLMQSRATSDIQPNEPRTETATPEPTP